MKKADLFDKISDEVWRIDWNVNSQAVGDSEGSLMYLAPYVFQTALSNSRIVKVENRQVFIRFKKTRDNRWRILILDVMEFMRRFLQHVLPTGFVKVRYYGFLNATCKVPLENIRALIELAYGFEVAMSEIEQIPPLPRPTCRTADRSTCFISLCRMSTWHTPDNIRRLCFITCCSCGPVGIVCAVNTPVWLCAV